MLLAENASAQLVHLGAALTAISKRLSSNTASRGVGVCVGVGVVWGFIDFLRRQVISKTSSCQARGAKRDQRPKLTISSAWRWSGASDIDASVSTALARDRGAIANEV